MVTTHPQFHNTLSALKLQERFEDLERNVWLKLCHLSNNGTDMGGVDISKLDEEISRVANNVTYFLMSELGKEEMTEHIINELKKMVDELLNKHHVMIDDDGLLQTKAYAELNNEMNYELTFKNFEQLAGTLTDDEREVFKFLDKEERDLANAIHGMDMLEKKIYRKIETWEKAIKDCSKELCNAGLYRHAERILYQIVKR